ncbi:hypothetical protein QBC43DRAFT_291022 [Cladorrhinum sp. PSN259]|nr:hypothetical protein QBC43DRAFT_291022 [Cladorrhinum sp. PSN259]
MFTRRRTLPKGTLVLTLLALTIFLLGISKLKNANTNTKIHDWLPFHQDDTDSKPASNIKCKDQSLEFLRTLEPSLYLTDTFTFSRKCIKPIYTPDLPRESITNISSSFFSSRNPQPEVSFSTCSSSTRLPPCDVLALPVPEPYPTEHNKYEHLLFGVASTYERIQSSLPAFKHWLAGTSARLVIVISDASRLPPKFTLADLEVQYRRAGILATVIPPRIKTALPRKGGEKQRRKADNKDRMMPVEELHFLLVQDLVERADDEEGGKKKTKWLGIVDDDTFFPSLYKLDEALRRYDYREKVWLGALADDWYSLTLFGHQAFGGAGIFLSLPLASALYPHLHSCIFNSRSKTGDSLLRDCIAAHTSTTLTILPGLNQHDLRSDASGFFESNPSPLLSIHHWKSWYKAPVVSISQVTKVCGDCLLRRYLFQDDDVVWVNGYSVNKYKKGVLQGLDMEKVEGTWEGAFSDALSSLEQEEEEGNKKGVGGGGGGGFEFAYGGLRAKLGEKERRRWKIVDARFVDDPDSGKRLLRQVYVWYDSERGDGEKGKDRVVEVIWEV